ncbi:MAG: hypothetical protein PHP46_01015 [Candidatus Omnitrophica bacterium]|nr:hypothetical protein [Candidatus Omnitrophota bacterium]
MSKRIMGAFLLLIGAFLVCLSPTLATETNEKQSAYQKVKDYVSSTTPYREVLTPEGEFVVAFNEKIAEWVAKKLDKQLIGEIRRTLAPHLRIELNKRGFASAATRAVSGKTDETHYDAIWVRDSVWIYYSLLQDPERREDARRMLLALWDYYATDAQISRFENIIADPKLSKDPMAMPHIRFDANSPDLGDVMIDGKPETWNHSQIDAHGLFFTALAEAIEKNMVGPNDLSEKRLKVLSLYPLFLYRIGFEEYEDAGAWEEIQRRNTSSIALATRSIQAWKSVMYGSKASDEAELFRDRFDEFLKKDGGKSEIHSMWTEPMLGRLVDRGLAKVKYQLRLGGESPDYDPEDIHFRLADFALVVLIQPSPLEGLSEEEARKALLIIETLVRPAGILRYRNDSYQSGNYWIKDTSEEEKDKPSLTGDTSSANAFLWRLSKLIPDTEAQWFFDSLLVLARLHLAEITKDPKLKREDIYFATVHLKRALGQITGEMITADGKNVKAWQTPESINTAVIDGKRYYLPSPITPLNWAKAGLMMALTEYERVVMDKDLSKPAIED